ncbi:WecB/TagA/CpsF family glycosyltransferase [Halobacillus sp. A5]|uniref:WecB/TagA/CpsF family glycosyltransferase n=1 Tax=Halobacillus sp. A5 TaxID=2880263 RepID=UPI0020A6D74C|nr:WecB/TagA/CpsF family glycosyltransferase [Halobacillus sp. A5]MCP3028082.1 WecB/TagA/CpsF family glycosyltransferase [Halobacillus sp. A5]
MKVNQAYVEIKGIPFLNTTHSELLQKYLVPSLLNENVFLVTANPEIVMEADRDPEYAEILRQADYVIADGIGVVIGSKLMRQPLPERIPGFEVMQDLLAQADREQLRCYFLGAKDTVLKKAINEIQKMYPRLIVSGYHHGYFELNDPEVVNTVKKAKPDIVFVGLGFPNQEKWIHEFRNEFTHGLFMGVGGSIDGLAGDVKRAPVLWRKLNLEWFYRLIQQPTRWKRMLQLPRFIWHILLKK